MKKIISQICSISILATSLNVASIPGAFAAAPTKTEAVHSVLANYSLNVERGESTIKSIVEATTSLQAQGISGQELVNFIAEGMEPQEAIAYKSAVASRIDIADSENLPVLLREVSESMSKGSNFRGCSSNLRTLNAVMGWTAVAFVAAAFSQNSKVRSRGNEIKEMQLKKTDMESDIAIYLGEGVRPDSFLIASVKKDIAYLDQQMAQKQTEADQASKNTQTFAIVAGATGAVFGIGYLSNCL